VRASSAKKASLYCSSLHRRRRAHSQCACKRTQHTAAQPLPLTTPPSARAAAPPPALDAIVDIYACRTQCRGCAVCCIGRLMERAGDGPIKCKHARRGRSTVSPSLLRSPLSQERQHKQIRHQIILAGRGKGRRQKWFRQVA